MKSFLFLMTACAVVSAARAAVLTTLPSPVQQGGMVHVNVSLQGSGLVVHLDAGTPAIKPLSEWNPGDTFDPASPWYSALDPAQGAGLFNSQYGFLIDAGSTDPLPDGSKIMVGWVSGSAGLEVYQYKNTAVQAFNPILGTGGSSATWDWSTVSHGMMHPMFVLPAGSSGAVTATLSFTLTDSGGVPLAGYTPANATLNFTVVPEPSAALLGALSAGLLLRRKRPLR